MSNAQKFFIKFKSIGCTDGLQVYMQSSQSLPQEMNKLMELFLKAESESISKMLQEALDKVKHQVLLTLRQHPQGEYYWDKILYSNYHFTELEELKAEIRGMAVQDFKSRFAEFFSCEECGKLSLQVYGEGTIDKNVALKSISENDMLSQNESISRRNEVLVDSMEELMSQC